MVNENLEEKLSFTYIFANITLFFIRLMGSILFGSVALLSDALNSFSDIISYFVIHLSIKISKKAPDKEHPYGHYRAQPLAAFFIAVLIGIMGLEIIKISIEKIITRDISIKTEEVLAILIITMFIKIAMWLTAKKGYEKTKSVALEAIAADSKNDILIDVVALMGVYMSSFGYVLFDPLAGLLISIFVIKSGYNIGTKNIKYLMGNSPGEEKIKEIEKKALSVKGVKKIHSIKAQYIGNKIQVEINAGVDSRKTINEAHNISSKVEEKIKEIEDIKECVVHIEPTKK
ncbi:MAG: cation diffusion facilitator family transporter [Candidatus Diapherotrites archaeon]|nr:cation diffusion facilitator family transporter [Candidatus Diapherotrites archaeon]